MRGFENGMPRIVVDIGPRSNPDTPHHRSQLIGDVVSVQVQGGDHGILFRNQQRILQESIGNHVFNDQLACGHGLSPGLIGRFHALFLLDGIVLTSRKGPIGKFSFGHFITPVLKSAFGKLHDISLVYQGHRRQSTFQRITDGTTHQTLRPFPRNGFYAERRAFRETDFRNAHLFGQELQKFGGFGGSGIPFDPGVNIFGIFPEDMHIDLLGFLNRRNHPLEPTNRTQTYEQIELLTQSHVQRTDTPTDRSGQRTLDTNLIGSESLHRFIRQPAPGLFKSLLTGQHLFPQNGPAVSIGFFQSSPHHALSRRRNFGTYTVPFNKRNFHLIGHLKPALRIDRH